MSFTVHLMLLILLAFVQFKKFNSYGYILSNKIVRNTLQKLNGNGRFPSVGLRDHNSINYDINDIPSSIRPAAFTGRGCVLIAQPGEFDHFLHHAVILIYNHSPQHGSVGVILDRPSPFTVDGAIPGFPEFRSNRLFLGGNDGSDTATIIHPHDLDMSKYIGYGLYIGGLKQASELVGKSQLPATDFKFIFNNVEWGPNVLEKEVETKRWDVCHLPVGWIISQSTEGNLWERCREELKAKNVP